jgi:hypothetical protein
MGAESEEVHRHEVTLRFAARPAPATESVTAGPPRGWMIGVGQGGHKLNPIWGPGLIPARNESQHGCPNR